MSETKNECCGTGFKVESVISVDERGQMVLPKEIRDKMQLKAGDKFAVAVLENGDLPCCITLIKTDALSGMVKNLLSPLFKVIGAEESGK